MFATSRSAAQAFTSSCGVMVETSGRVKSGRLPRISVIVIDGSRRSPPLRRFSRAMLSNCLEVDHLTGRSGFS